MTDNSGNDELNALGYTSSAPDFAGLAGATDVRPQDEADLSALIQVSRLLKSRKEYYQRIDSIKFGVDLTVENQSIINTRMTLLIQELEGLVNSTVQQVKETLNER